jgi:hypothetical protein
MATLTKPEARAALTAAGIPRNAFSRREICARNHISEGFYRKLLSEGLGPKETRILDRVIITVEDEAEWLRRLKREG